MKIASAQIQSTVGEIQSNLEIHYTMIEEAFQNEVDLIVFPEMSITGYCREEAEKLAFDRRDRRLDKLKKQSTDFNIAIIAGAPIIIESKMYIGSFIITPNEETKIYLKQYLHKGEEMFYSSSFNFNPILRIKDEVILLAICADIANEQHPKNAKNNNCSLYLASIFYTEEGIFDGHKSLANHALNNSFSILMSNFSGKTWNLKSGGRSAFWNKEGSKLAELSTSKQGLLIIEKQGESWKPITQNINNILQNSYSH